MMTDSEISLKIAERFGWFQQPASVDIWHSPGCRWREQRDSCKGFAANCGRIAPPDFVNDPAMTVMLMSRPDFVRLQRFVDSFTKEDKYFAEFKEPIRQAETSGLRRAVAEAFYKGLS